MKILLAVLVALSLGAAARADQPGRAEPADAADGGTPPDDKSALEEMLEADDDEPADERGPAGAPPPASRGEGAGRKADRRGEISDELALGSAQSTPENPRGGQISNLLRGSLFLSDQVTLNAGLTFTLEQGAPPPPDSKFQASYGGNVALFTVGADWDPSEHVTLGVHFDASPSSEQFSSNAITYAAPTEPKAPACPDPSHPPANATNCPIQTDALLRTRSSSLALGASASYDTAGDRDLEGAFSFAASASSLSSDERITEVQGRRGRVVNANDLRIYCAGGPKRCSKQLRSVLGEQSFSLLQTRTSAAATATLWLDTDATLAGDYYFYSDDPSKLGYFGPATAGRSSFLGGGGVPIAPVQWAVRPELVHRFGRAFSARLWLMHGQYVEGTGGDTNALGARLQYKFSRSFKLWLTASGQKDIDVDGTESKTGMLGLGAAYRF